MQHDSEQLRQDIDATRDDWDRKKGDVAVPGAGGDPLKRDPEDRVSSGESARDREPLEEEER